MADRVGQQLGHYRLLRVLGQGAFAEVYLGKHLYLERLAAIKVLHVQMEPAAQEQFRREACTIAHLQHPHIVQVLDFGFDDQTPYLVMEYTPGGTLRSHHPKGTRLPLEQIVTYVKQTASALDYAHQQHIIHRDVKPENLLLNAKHEIVLSDFGIAVVQRTIGPLSTQQPAGTPLYMAPEQIQGKPCAASDQYSLAVVVYEWLCGEPPFRGSLFEVYSQHLYQPPPGLCVRVPHLPQTVEDVVLGALTKDPHQRFSSVQDFATVLEQASFATQPPAPPILLERQGQDQQALPATLSALAPIPKPPRSYIFLALSLTLLLLLIGTAGAGYWIMGPLVQPTVTAGVPTKTGPAGKDEYETYVAEHGMMFGFNAAHTHANPYEHRLTVANVSGLRQKWAVSTGGQINSSPAIADGVVYVGSQDGKLYAFDAASGVQKWSASTGGQINSSPAIADGVVYVGSQDGKLYAFDAASGVQKWAVANGGSDSSPVIAGGVIYVGALDNHLYAFDTTTGVQKWDAITGREIYSSSPAVAGGIVYVGCYDNKLYAFDASSGVQKWAVAIAEHWIQSSPAVAEGVVYVSSTDGKLYAFDAVSGQQKWATATGGWIFSSPAIAGGLVYVGSHDSKLYAFDAVSGRQKWSTSTGGQIGSSPTVAGGVVYVGSYDGKLYAFDASSGVQKWSASTGGGDSSPAIAGGVVYIGSSDHEIYAFSPESSQS